MTAWPTKAANPSAMPSTPRGKSALESSAIVISSSDGRPACRVSSGDRCAARLGAGRRRHRDGLGLDLEDEAAVGAGVDGGHATQAAHRADDGELVVAAIAAERAR